ncbi:tail fiber domain-containing protein [Leclercia adecarboxylata]|uniref:Tail fiber domain-containing protein n=1 Tax=Leclercia adecarboxylata TaxID=83655 RepID=A0A9X3Y9Q3_9ENTR|nr:tail fiber domain-containing protein [Leclercia adecarboxylata]MBD1404214.1 tail fiber domain-containing protein [Leclercia adecarboxylata]MDC6621843.1 tail fiber domain-containing protein [Leclercia adecarboxylata]MDC6632916.1 tail fiber domain-containing protein [Leclercia adecarboxylata]MDC6638211.1 tail fiber domain-containing protein [Leclercia adecarboxylata]MDC6648954.1 tail fiber domain-containing protein [Leclercia adecarboxylata]
MTTYATNNPIGSMDPKDLFDNAQNLDFALNDIAQAFWKDRFGRFRKSFWGMEQESAAQLLMQQLRFNAFIQNSGYDVIGEYTDGPLTISEYNQLIRYDGELWKLNASTGIHFTTTGNDAASWANDSVHFVSVGDGALRQELLGKRVYAVDFGPAPNGVDLDTDTIQKAIDYVYSLGGGVVDLGPFNWRIGSSSLNEIYDAAGVAVPAAQCGIILRKRVSLIGQKGKTSIFEVDPTLHAIGLVANDGNVLSGFELYSTWNMGVTGAGHGILHLGTQGGADTSCANSVFSDLYVHNVGSYGIGLQVGNPNNVHLSRIRVDTVGADGLDLKARTDVTIDPVGNSVSDVHISNHGLRVTGSAGVDMRGVWHCRGITVTNFGKNAAFNFCGIRFRTKPPSTDLYPYAGAKSTLAGFMVDPYPGAASSELSGIECGSDDVHISLGTIANVKQGVAWVGNANGTPTRCSATGITTKNCALYGFWVGAGIDNIQFSDCFDTGSATGFRIDGTNVAAIGCSGTLVKSIVALPTFIETACRFGAAAVSAERLSDTTVALSAKGTAPDINLRLSPKGTGFISAYGDIRPDAANTRYIGTNSLPWAGGFTQTAFTVTSGARFKTDPLEITDAMLDAAAECPPIQYQLLDRVAAKGPDGARWHFGTIAERLEEAFNRHGLDVRRFAFFCEDYISYKAAVIDEDTGLVLEPEQEEGIRLGVRYEELLMLEAALQRRNYARLLADQETMAARIEKLESLLSKAN